MEGEKGEKKRKEKRSEGKKDKESREKKEEEAGGREKLVSLLDTIFTKNSEVEPLLTKVSILFMMIIIIYLSFPSLFSHFPPIFKKDDVEGGAVYYRRLEKTIRLIFGDRYDELIQLVCPENVLISFLPSLSFLSLLPFPFPLLPFSS